MKLIKGRTLLKCLVAGGLLTTGGMILNKQLLMKENRPRVQIKFISKKDFLAEFMPNNTDHMLLIVYPHFKLKGNEAIEREKALLDFSKTLALKVGHLSNDFKILLFKEEDFRVVEKTWESVTKDKMTINLKGDKEAYLYFKRPEYSEVFPLNQSSRLSSVQEISDFEGIETIKKKVCRISQPVYEIKTEAELRRELVRNIGVNNRPIIVDVCDSLNMSFEKERLKRYILSRISAGAIPIDTRALLIDSAVLKARESQVPTNTLHVVKNDFLNLVELSKTFSEDPAFRSEDPHQASDFYFRRILAMSLKDVKNGGFPNFIAHSSSDSLNSVLDELIAPEVPLFFHDSQEEQMRLFTHIHQNDGKKVLSLNLLKDDAYSMNYAYRLYDLAKSPNLKEKLCFQVFSESSFDNLLKHLNRYYSPFCVYDLRTTVGKSNQKLFVPPLPGYPSSFFVSKLNEVLATAADKNITEHVNFSEDSIEVLSSRSFEFYKMRNRDKNRVTLLLDKTPSITEVNKPSLQYERLLLSLFKENPSLTVKSNGSQDTPAALSRLYYPDTIPGLNQTVQFPALLVGKAGQTRESLLELPPYPLNQQELDDLANNLRSILSSLLHNQ
jgi:hypothetical protein